jgi:hypothetical protein
LELGSLFDCSWEPEDQFLSDFYFILFIYFLSVEPKCRVVGFEVLTTVAIFFDIASYRPYVNRRFGGTYNHLHDRKSSEQETSA